jgi:hypothetical protein
MMTCLTAFSVYANNIGDQLVCDTNEMSTITCDITENHQHYIKNIDENLDYMYIGNKNTLKYHLPTCQHLPAEKNRVYFKDFDDIPSDYTPCQICLPTSIHKN